MANTQKSVPVTQLTTSMSTLYTLPSSTNFTVTMLHICNVTGSAATVRLCLVPNGGSPTAANAILWDFSIAANDVQELLKGDIWIDGAGPATIQAQASANTSINIKLAGIETT